MRTLSQEEKVCISGGLYPVGGFGGLGGGSPGGGNGSGSGGAPGGGGVTQQELDNGLRTVISEYEAGEFSSTMSSVLFDAYSWTTVSSDVIVDQISYAKDVCNMYLIEDDPADEHQAAQDQLIHWENVDWSVYTDNGTLSCDQAVDNFFQDMINNHHFALNVLSPDLSKTSSGGGGGGDSMQPIYQEPSSGSGGDSWWLEATTEPPVGTVTVGSPTELHWAGDGGFIDWDPDDLPSF